MFVDCSFSITLQFAFGLVMLIYSWVKLGLAFTPLMLLKMVVFLITASLIMIALQNAAAATCFWIQNSFYMLDFVFRFKDYAKYPVTIFSPMFRFIFTFLMLIAFIAYYPSLVILRPDKVPVLSWLSPVIGIAFFFVSYKIWMHGAKNYSGTGS